MNKKVVIAVFVIVLIAVIGYRVQLAIEGANQRYNTEVHVHADFAVYMNGSKIDFGQTEYQSSVSHEKTKTCTCMMVTGKSYTVTLKESPLRSFSNLSVTNSRATASRLTPRSNTAPTHQALLLFM
jgi:hypothetical protein